MKDKNFPFSFEKEGEETQPDGNQVIEFIEMPIPKKKLKVKSLIKQSYEEVFIISNCKNGKLSKCLKCPKCGKSITHEDKEHK
jgi:hypothetical protein